MTRAMRRMRKYLLIVACIALVAGMAIGGTIAWLADSTQEVKNTFSPSGIDIELDEHEYDAEKNELTATVAEDKANDNYVMVPSKVLPKDPYVTVESGSEACYVFVEITKSNNYDTYLEPYEVADGWSKLEENGLTVVYYRTNNVPASDEDQTFFVLKGTTKDAQDEVINANGEIVVKNEVTLSQMQALTETTKPTLTFKAYAIQELGITTPAEAWTQIGKEAWATTTGGPNVTPTPAPATGA